MLGKIKTWYMCLWLIAGVGWGAVSYSAPIASPKDASVPWWLRSAEVPQAWEVTKGEEDVLVAVIDTGVDITHPALKNRIWVNPKEIPNNGMDDDRNGYVDDIHGWNFADGSNDVQDDHGHGTHVAGVIVAKRESGSMVEGVAPGVKIMVIKYFKPDETDGAKNLARTVAAFEYVLKCGAKVHIVNYSAGGPEFSASEYKVLKALADKGILIVAAAGNEGMDMRQMQFYPAAYPLPNVIAVGSVGEGKDLLPHSNYGPKTVTIAAPGHRIRSTVPRGYGVLTGTSQATPFVTGTAALMLSVAHSLTPEQIKQIVQAHARPVGGLVGKIAAGGILSAHQAVVQASAIQYEILKTFYAESLKAPPVIRHTSDFDFVAL